MDREEILSRARNSEDEGAEWARITEERYGLTGYSISAAIMLVIGGVLDLAFGGPYELLYLGASIVYFSGLFAGSLGRYRMAKQGEPMRGLLQSTEDAEEVPCEPSRRPTILFGATVALLCADLVLQILIQQGIL